MGYAAAHEVLVDLGPFLTEAEKLLCAADSVGPSWDSYWYQGGLWALPIDAATQVASYRPDLLQQSGPAPPNTLDEVLTLARKAREFGKFIVVPACPTDAISLFFTLSANLGHPIAEASELFVDRGGWARSFRSPPHPDFGSPPQLGGVESDPGLRFHDFDFGCDLLPLRLWIFELFARRQGCAVEVRQRPRSRPARLCGNHAGWDGHCHQQEKPAPGKSNRIREMARKSGTSARNILPRRRPTRKSVGVDRSDDRRRSWTDFFRERCRRCKQLTCALDSMDLSDFSKLRE